MDFYKLKKRFEETKGYKDRWLGLYTDLYNLVIPDRNAFNVKQNYNDDGSPLTQQIFDNTAVLAAYQRANDLHSLTMPYDRVWMRIALDPHLTSTASIAAMQPTIDEINDRVMFFLNQSNLARVVSQSNLDLCGGTAVIWVETKSEEEPLYFRSIPAVATYIEYSNDDTLNTCWYQCKKLARSVLEEFPDYKSTLGISALSSDLDQTVIVLYGQIKQPDGKFYIYAVLQDIDPFTPLWEVERDYQQVIIYRDRLRPGESDGRGIALDMLPTIRDLNKLRKENRKSKAYKANPPMFYDNNKYFNPNSIRSWSGVFIPKMQGQPNPMSALEMPTYPDVLEEIKWMQDEIRIGFQVDPLGEINSPVRSATEVSIRENRAQRTSSTDISRLINELPRQIYTVALKILDELNMLTKDGKVGDIKLHKFKFDFQSPLFDLQKRDDVSHFIENLQIKQQFFGQGAAMATVNLPEANDFLTDRLNLKSKLFKTGPELMQIVKAANQQQQQQQMAQSMPTPSTSGSEVPLPQPSGVTI